MYIFNMVLITIWLGLVLGYTYYVVNLLREIKITENDLFERLIFIIGLVFAAGMLYSMIWSNVK